MPLYSVVIPTFNHCDDLLKPCVESILEFTDPNLIELIIVPNGCTDNTNSYLRELIDSGKFPHIKHSTWPSPLGYAKATNAGIKLATTDNIILLNNDVILLNQRKNLWLDMLEAPFLEDPDVGISCVVKSYSAPAAHDFAIFFCVMIHRKVFDKLGLLNEEYGKGGGEDTEFSIEAENAGFKVVQTSPISWGNKIYEGSFPLYHKGEGTVHDKELVPDWNDVFLRNSLKLAKKYNPEWYQWKISNDSERGVFFKGQTVFPREVKRYNFAAQHLIGPRVLEIGCSSGFGFQFLPKGIDYLGIDNDQTIIAAANEQDWGINARFGCADILTLDLPNDSYDTIIAFETIEHIRNGLSILNKLKNAAKRLIVTVPFNESPGQFSPHHKIHHLTIDKFPGFVEIGLIDIDGNIITDKSKLVPNTEYNLLMTWNRPANFVHLRDPFEVLGFMEKQYPEVYKEVILDNCYEITRQDMENREVIDVGANFGVFANLAGILGARRVIAIEPVTKTHGVLIENIIQAENQDFIIPLRKVVSDVSGDFVKIGIHDDDNSGHNSLYTPTGKEELIETVTLHDVISKHLKTKDIFLKMDCEGAEYDIITKATVEDFSRITHIALEVHADLHPIHKGFEIIEENLRRLGFEQKKVKQIYSWKIAPDGTPFDYKPIPYRIEIWKRKGAK